MLFRVSGKLTDGVPFASRIEAGSAIEGVVIGRKALNDAGVGDAQVAQIQSRPMKGGKSVTFGKVRAPKAGAPKTSGKKK